jgi:molecular chaperone DnaJ
MAEENYYEILGVNKDSTREEIKKAYKKLARKYHPDNKDTGDSDKFKKINEAAAILSDDKKRQQYDQFGKEGANMGGMGGFDFNSFEDAFSSFGGDFENIFDHLGEMFGQQFGFSGFGGGGKRRRQIQGSDLRYDLDITLEEAAFGTTKTVEIMRQGTCNSCGGSGAESSSDVITCPECKGRGRIQRIQRTPFGMVQTVGACHKCHGQGKIIEKECEECDGTGVVRIKKKLELKVPPGIDDNMRLRVEGEGDAAPKGGVSGDLYVFIHVKQDKNFERRGNDIYVEYPITISQAALGCEIEVPTLLGKAKLKIPSGTQPETTFRMKEKGIQDLRGSSKGDQLVKVKVKIPKSLSRKEKKLFEDLDDESKKSGFFKSLFN